jgi:uncharacterized protein YcaQ
MKEIVSKEELRQFLINYHNLNDCENFTGKDGVIKYFKRVSSIQYDPLNVVGRNPDLVLQSRVLEYKPEMLHSLLYEEHVLIDGYDKEMNIYMVEDYPLFSKIREAHAQRTKYVLAYRGQLEALDLLDDIRKHIRENGITGTKDISIGVSRNSRWGHKKLSSAALDYLYSTGELCVAEKRGILKYFDFTSNIIPKEYCFNYEFENEEEFLKWYTKRRIRSVGALWERNGSGWLGHYISDSRKRKSAIKILHEEGEILQFYVTGINIPFYIAKEDENFFNYRKNEKKAKFLAPLDNMLWDRDMVAKLFDFEYRWEVYTPVEKRKYGYYVLPVIYGNRFVARFEPEKITSGVPFAIKSWYWEPGIEITDEMLGAIDAAISRFAEHLGVPRLQSYSNIMKKTE